jgi:hypothetical protein
MLAVIAAAMMGMGTMAFAGEVVVAFDDGMQDWSVGPDYHEDYEEGGNPGSYLRFSNLNWETQEGFFRGWFNIENAIDKAFVGDYTSRGPVTLSVDLDINFYDYESFSGPMEVEEYRDMVFEFISLPEGCVWGEPCGQDNGNGYPWNSVYYNVGYLHSRDAGWKTYTVEIENPQATDMPEGWGGTGAEDPDTYEPVLPPGVTFADVMADVDVIRITTLVPGWYYEYAFLHDINVDNIAIVSEDAGGCTGLAPTIFVDESGVIHGGQLDGQVYDGRLLGSEGDDIIAGTVGNDTIYGYGGNDVICGSDGHDRIHGGDGDDVIYGGAGIDRILGGAGSDELIGGEGYDILYGGAGNDTCEGESTSSCEDLIGGEGPSIGGNTDRMMSPR